MKLLEERDADLKHYEQLFEQLRGNDNLSNQKVSDMKIKVDEFQMKFNLLQKEKEELQRHYQGRLKHYQEDVNKFYMEKEEERRGEREEYEQLKKSLQVKIDDTQHELEFEKQRVLKQTEDAIKQKENECRGRLNKSEGEVHSYQLKVKSLASELHTLRSCNTEALESAENNRGTAMQLGKVLKEKEWELEDVKNTSDIRIKELTFKMEEYERNLKWKTEEFERKYSEMEKLSNEREGVLKNLKEAADTNEAKLHNELLSLQKRKEEMEVENKRLQWDLSDKVREMNKEFERLNAKISTQDIKYKEEMENMNKIIAAKDVEMEALKSSEDSLRKDNVRLKGSVEKLKKELTLSLEREKILENAKVQLELEWRRRYETKESELFSKHDDLIQSINNEKDEALDRLKTKENELNRHENLIKLLEDDKEIALKCLKEHGVNTDHLFADRIPERESDAKVHVSKGSKKEMELLVKQNEELKEVIGIMRDEMELLSQQAKSSHSTPNKDNGALNKANGSSNKDNGVPNKLHNDGGNSKYTNELEQEVQDLKAANRNLLLKVEDLTRNEKPPSGVATKLNINQLDSGVKGHHNSRELNDLVGALKNENVKLSAVVNSKELALKHLNEIYSQLKSEKDQQSTQFDKLQFDFTSKSKVFELNITTLKQRVSELELQLQQSRSEAETYYKSVVERNHDIAIQQPINLTSTRGVSNSAAFYKDKLRIAVERIKELSFERSRLINVGNKYRAELKKYREGQLEKNKDGGGEGLTSSTPSRKMHDYVEKVKSRLESLQQLKYEATIKELRNDYKDIEDIDVNIVNSDDSDKVVAVTRDDSDKVLEKPQNNNDSQNNNNNNITDFSSINLHSSESSSLKEIWNLLENAEEVSSVAEEVFEGDQGLDDMKLEGVRIEPVTKQVQGTRKQTVARQKGMVNKSKKKTMVRNYNKTDDDSKQ